MRNPFVHRIGGVLSADIAVPEHERELAFYSTVLTTGGAPLWRDDLLNNHGTPIIGLGVRTPEYSALPLQWMPHFQVADVAASATLAVELGGKELMHGKDEKGQSQWAVLVDRDDAAFGVIPVVEDESKVLQPKERPGCIAWLSLKVPDASASQDFYQNVVGWKSHAIDPGAANVPRVEMKVDDETIAAEIHQVANEEDGIPTVWLIHLPVDDLDESLKRVIEKGGAIIKEYPEPERRAIIRDPMGVFLALQVIA